MIRTSIISALVAVSAASLVEARAVESEIIPFEISETGHLIVNLTLNDHTDFDAILDTGATFPILDQRSADTVGILLPEVPLLVDIIGLGSVLTFPVVNVDSLSFGDIRLIGVQAAYNAQFKFPATGNIIPSSSIPHRTLDFDFANSRLLAYDRRPLTPSRSTVSSLPITRINGLPFIDVRVNGKKGLALIDTGASLTFVNSVFAEGAARSPESIQTVELVGATGKLQSIKVLTSRDFQLGEFGVERFNVVVSDPEVLEVYGLADQAVMVLGLDILKSFRLQIDREKNEARLSQPRKISDMPGFSIRRK